MISKALKQRELDQIQQQLQIIASTVRAKTNQVGSAYKSISHTFYSSLFNLNRSEIIFRAKNEYEAHERLKIFEDASSAFQSIYYHYMDIFGPNPVPEWVDQYLKMCEYRNILSISAFNEFIAAHLLSGQTLYQDPNKPVIPQLSDDDAPNYIRNFAKDNVNDPSIVEQINKLFPPPASKTIYYPKLADPDTLM